MNNRPIWQQRVALAKLSRASKGGIISVGEAAIAMGISTRTASRGLGSLVRQGWARKIRRGIFLIVSPEVEPGRAVIPEDPWLLADKLYSPCYIAGWSAAEHWGLTEQLFRSTAVVTAANVRQTQETVAAHRFRLFKVNPNRITGFVHVWRGSARVAVSSLERTIVDGLRRPELCGGIRQVASIMKAYGQSKEHDFKKVLEEASRSGNGATWKRLGYVAEQIWPRSPIQDVALPKISKGYSSLDPTIKRRGKLVRKWNLWVNSALDNESAPA